MESFPTGVQNACHEVSALLRTGHRRCRRNDGLTTARTSSISRWRTSCSVGLRQIGAGSRRRDRGSAAVARPTIRDVAHEAGVGLGTVSRVLAGGQQVAEGTRQRVAAAIERLGYHPNPSARALKQGRAQTIEVIAPLLVRFYYFEVVGGILAALAATDYSLIVRVLERPPDAERAFAEVDRRGPSAGVLIVRARPSDELVARLARSEIPVVLVDAPRPDLPGVGVDHRCAAAMMTEHLLALGHRRVALADRPDDPFDAAVLRARRQGYREALGRAGVEPRPQYEPPTDWSAEGGAAALEALLTLAEPPTAIMTGSDTQAIGVLDQARRRGLAVPGDLAVCGYGDIELARYLDLTTVRVPMRAMGELAVARLLAAINGQEHRAEQLLLPAELVIRATCGAPRARS
jgi:DNA-binding LacI/PurR family transcriptional regulator